VAAFLEDCSCSRHDGHIGFDGPKRLEWRSGPRKERAIVCMRFPVFCPSTRGAPSAPIFESELPEDG
jgi:hypothetical protein